MVKRATPADSLLHAVDQTFQVAAGQAQTTRGRAQDLVDDLAQTAGRLRGALEELRPPTGEDVRGVQAKLSTLEGRVSELEQRIASLTPSPRSRSSRGARAATASGGRKSSAGAKTARRRKSASAAKAAGGRKSSGATTGAGRSAPRPSAGGR